MQQPPEITFNHMPESDAVRQRIQERIDKLHQFCGDIISCHVTIDTVKNGQQQGKEFNARIHLTVPGEDFTVTNHTNENLYLSIRDSFDSMDRNLEDFSRRRQGTVKTHPDILLGHIARLFEEGDYGFIKGMDTEEYYFNKSNLTKKLSFKKLKVGDEIWFSPAIGDDGLQAHHVRKR